MFHFIAQNDLVLHWPFDKVKHFDVSTSTDFI